ncbi:MAG: hypothetical protein OZSIB_0210 [Candidatus Ozemobacter sibiricus]|uniref:Uncharacterized protein n=1 Tax=Candidatus Ozemobacter sibiricus TaxID=2268124 RepID=A0A367ZNK8_9BACT|nr:MAG: hypothetical protein OZSIB_0210 [Candidatus Ozemobacter sibiricus]
MPRARRRTSRHAFLRRLAWPPTNSDGVRVPRLGSLRRERAARRRGWLFPKLGRRMDLPHFDDLLSPFLRSSVPVR